MRKWIQSKSIRYLLKVVSLFIIVSFVIISAVSIVYIESMSRKYDRLIHNIELANSISHIAKEEIGRECWFLLAGRVQPEQGRELQVLEQIEQGLTQIDAATADVTGREYIEASIRGSRTLRQYVERLRRQMQERDAVFSAERTLDDINQVAANIYEALQEFIHAQTLAIGLANNAMQRTSEWMLLLISFVSLLLLGISIFAYRILQRAIARPCVEIAAMAERIVKGDLETQVPPPGLTELNQLADGINLMSSRIRILLDERIQKQKDLQMAEIRTLQAQITPHFLYNTLDTIVWLAEGGYNDKVVEVTMAFSHFYRVMLSRGRDYIPVKEEVQHIRDYLVIQSVRYQDILSYEIHMEEAIYACHMLKLLLQPLVENAIYHGIKNKHGGGTIKITGKALSETLIEFCVQDDGIGMQETALAQLRKAIAGKEPPPTHGYGLYNVNRRMRLYYHNAGMHIESTYGAGTRITFQIPTEAPKQ